MHVVIAATSLGGLRVLGGFFFAAVVRGGYRALKRWRENLRQIAAVQARAAYDIAYREKLAAYDAHYKATADRERSTGA